MRRTVTTLLRNLAIALVIIVITVLAWLTDPGEPDPCATVNDDIAAALLADPEDSDAMMTRALGVRAQCEPKPPESEPESSKQPDHSTESETPDQ
jgi:hypothetical protein